MVGLPHGEILYQTVVTLLDACRKDARRKRGESVAMRCERPTPAMARYSAVHACSSWNQCLHQHLIRVERTRSTEASLPDNPYRNASRIRRAETCGSKDLASQASHKSRV